MQKHSLSTHTSYAAVSLEEWTELIKNRTPELSEYLFELAREERHKYYGHDVYVRGLIEFTNYCRNDCLYCGIRKSNPTINAVPT